MKGIILFLALFTSTARALETDNYLVWNKELADSSSHINRFFAEGITAALERIPDHNKLSCEKVTQAIANDFASYLVHDNPVENWLFDVLSDKEMFPADIYHVEESIYREPHRFYIPWFGLAPNIQVNGNYFGTDKLSHFASTGMIYFKIFRKGLGQGKSVAEAERDAINWGIKDEKTVHGYWASGVFSYADLESNYQGLKFYRRFCEGNRPYLLHDGERWKLSASPDIREYVNGLWDETFEESYRLPDNARKVSDVLSENYCTQRNTPAVQNRLHRYRSFVASPSKTYLETLKRSGKLPLPQRLIDLCRY